MKIGADPAGLEAGFKKANSYIAAHEKQFKKVGKGVTIAGAAIVGTFGLMVNAAIGFNKEMAAISTLIPGQGKRLQELKKVVQDLAMTYGTSTTDIAQGLYQVISAFGDSADAAKILEINVKAAAAGLATTTDAINLTSAVTKAYGDTSAEAVQRVSDLAFQAVKLGQTTFPELAGSIGKVTPLAKELNLSQEELFGTFATLTGVTGKASEVTTQFSGILAAMIKPTEGMDVAMAGLGKEIGLGENATAKAIVAELGFKGTLEGLKAQTDGTTKGLGKLFESKEALVGLLPLLSSQSKVYDDKLKEMAGSAGLTDEAFLEMSEGVNKAGFDMEKLKQMTVVLAQRLGDSLAPTIGNISIAVGKAVQQVSEWVTENPKLVATLLKIVGGLGALAVVLGPILMMLPGITIAMTTLGNTALVVAAKAKFLALANKILGASFTTMFGPISIIITIITALAAAAFLIYKNWEPIKNFFSKLWVSVSGFFVTAFNNIKKKLLDWAIAIVGVLEKIPFAKKLAGPWKETLQSMRDEMDKTVAHISQSVTEVTAEGKAMAGAFVDWVGKMEGAGAIAKVLGSAFLSMGDDADESAGGIGSVKKKIQEATEAIETQLYPALGKISPMLLGIVNRWGESTGVMEEKITNLSLVFPEVLEPAALITMEDIGNAMSSLGSHTRKITEDIKKSWKEALLEIAEVASVVINGLDTAFAQAFKNQMIRIDNEEKATLDALDNKYDAHIRAANDLLTLEQQTSAARFDELQTWYEQQKKAIEDSTMDEEAKAKALKKLDNKLARKRKRLIEEREVAEKAAADALEQLEYAKNEALRIASEDL